MNFELTLGWNFIQAYDDVGIDFTPYKEFVYKYDFQQEMLPKSVTCLCSLKGKATPVHMTIFSAPPWARIKFETDNDELAGKIRQKLLKYSTEDKNGNIYKDWNTRQISNQILARDGLNMNDIQARKGVMSRDCLDALMRHYEETESRFRYDICWLFTREAVPKTELVRVAKWLVNHLAQTRDFSSGDRIQEQLYNHLAVPEIADDLIRLLTDRNFKGRSGFLLEVLAKTKDRRVLEVAASLLDEDTITQRDDYLANSALAIIGRRKAAQHVERVRKFLSHRSPEIRREAKKTMKRLGHPVEIPPAPVHLVKNRRLLPKGLEEWSTNQDMEDLEPTLQTLSKCVQSGFGAKEIAEVAGVVEEMNHDQTKAFCFQVMANKQEEEVWLVIFMDDIDSPDLEIHAGARLIEKFNKAMPQRD
jgi:hypothetical protein